MILKRKFWTKLKSRLFGWKSVPIKSSPAPKQHKQPQPTWNNSMKKWLLTARGGEGRVESCLVSANFGGGEFFLSSLTNNSNNVGGVDNKLLVGY